MNNLKIINKMSLMCISILVLNGCLAMTVVSGVTGAIDSVRKEMKITKLENQIQKLETEKKKKNKKWKKSVDKITLFLYNK